MKDQLDRQQSYRGIVPAFYTCFDDEGQVSEKRCRLLARHLQKAGVQGLYVGGSSGECIYLGVEERMRLLEAVMDEVGDELVIIAHVACNNTKDSKVLAAHAESLKVDAIAAIPPIYFRLPEASIAAYWNAISASAPNTDFFIYNIPQLAGVALTPGLYAEMLKNPLVAGVKNSSMPTMDIERFKRQDPSRIIWNGPDEQLASGLIMGASGGIGGTYAVMPKLYLAIEAAVCRGDLEKAQALQAQATDLIGKLCSGKGHMYAMAKAVLSRQLGQDLGSVRAPLAPMQAGDEVIADALWRDIDQVYCDLL